MVKITLSAIESARKHAKESFPEECCGFLASSLDGIIMESVRCNNMQNLLHKKNLAENPRTAKEAYQIDGLEQLRMEKILDNRGLCIAGVYHSHANAKAYFSEEDKQRAMLGNEPMWPDAHYLVISVVNCNVLNAKSFAWDYSKRDFAEENIDIL